MLSARPSRATEADTFAPQSKARARASTLSRDKDTRGHVHLHASGGVVKDGVAQIETKVDDIPVGCHRKQESGHTQGEQHAMQAHERATGKNDHQSAWRVAVRYNHMRNAIE